MEALTHIQRGLNIASDSFLFLWQHKKLLLYLLIPVVLNLLLGIYSAYDFVYAFIVRGAPTALFPLIIAMSKAIIADFGIACLAVHTLLILRDRGSSVRATIRTVIHRAPLIIAWSLIAGALIYVALTILHVISMPFENMPLVLFLISALEVALGIVWLIDVFYMIQILAIEELSLIESFHLSRKLARVTLLEILGGEFWIGLMYGLGTLPFMLLFEKLMAYHLFNNQAIHDWSWITIYALILLGWICATVQTVFRTELYYRCYILPREQELDAMLYRRF